MARGAARNVHRTVEHACADKERAGCKGCNGGVRPKGTFQCPFRLWVWRTPFMGDAEEGIRPRPMFGEQITDC